MASEPISLLLIDDDDVEAEMVHRSLKKVKIANEVIRARDGIEGLALLRGQGERKISGPVLILLDLNMPRMNGLEFLEAIRADERLQQLVVFVLTTSNDENDKAAAYTQNVAGYIVKSHAGRDFMNLMDMIEMFWRLVEFPQAPQA
ncbi:Response regulator receiver domain-containing protein [Prosthecobacter debontii]|uniref:Response regulator receiver domain-containing protein n=1 Tax=Prosthecobacter debontii TaxID=48467 RepID=A0A1T4Y5M3_9BACT|nr:response regulator [Prosthecobacter debontii]SKA97030.1 Response regulator receiver domain-containing protein [Prosthecobacter debontii]